MTDHNEDINKRYQQSAKELPSLEVDNHITELAKQSLKLKTPSSMVKHQQLWPYSLVASVMLIGVLVLNFPNNYLSPPALKGLPQAEPAEETTEILHSKPNVEAAPMMELKQAAPKIKKRQAQRQLMMSDENSSFNEKLATTPISNAKKISSLITVIESQLEKGNEKQAKTNAIHLVERYGKGKLPPQYHYLLTKKVK